MSIHGMSMFTEPIFFYRGRHGQVSEEGKEDREGSHQEGGKEDFKEKEVVVSTTETLAPSGRNPDAQQDLSKGSECPLQPVGITASQDKAGSLCRWRLHKGPVFRFCPDGHDLLLREGSKPHGRDAPRLGSREPGPALAGRTNGKEDPGLEASDFLARVCLPVPDDDLKHRESLLRLFTARPSTVPGDKFHASVADSRARYPSKP
jgi:hypothetical protein